MSEVTPEKTWGSYEWDNDKTHSENIDGARNANALITTDDLQRYENAIASLTSQLRLLEQTVQNLSDILNSQLVPDDYT